MNCVFKISCKRIHVLFALIIALCMLCTSASHAYANDVIDLGAGNEDIESIVAQEYQYIARGAWGSCLWEINKEGKLIIAPGNGESQHGKMSSPWIDYGQSIKLIWFMSAGGQKVVLQDSADYLLSGLTNVTGIDLEGLEFNNVTSAAHMFDNCVSLCHVINMNIDTSHINNMSYMFNKCEALFDIDFNRMDTSNVTDMSYMFCMCGQIDENIISGLNMSKVDNIESMFEYCKSIDNIDFQTLGLTKVTGIANVFKGCSNLESVALHGVDTSNVSAMQGMFLGCNLLKNVDVSMLDTSSVYTMEAMFQDCSSLENLDLSMLNTSNLINAYGMCSGCSNLNKANVSNWDTSKLQNIGGMFTNCFKLAWLDLSHWNTASVTNARYLFNGCQSLESLDLSGWDTRGINNAQSMFANCKCLATFTIGTTYTIKNTNMFPNATSSNGMWWSMHDKEWYTKDQIVSSRKNVADTYTAVSGEGHKTSINNATIMLEINEYAWTGEGITPAPKVMYNGMTLAMGKDYALSYANNVKVGTNTAVVTITGLGSYTGSKSLHFSITYDNSFKDVTAKTAHVEDIIWTSINGISTGFPDGTFRPRSSVARADMAAFLFRLACKWGLVDKSWRAPMKMTTYIDDVSDTTPHVREIRWLVSTGISKGWVFERGGYEFTRFRPYSTVARQDMAAFLYRLAELAAKGGASSAWTADADAKTMFRDVDAQNANNHHNEVWWLAQTGVSEGWTVDGGKREFRGLQNVARQDMAAFLHRVDSLGN